MSAEAWIGLLSLPITGLCFLMWNTDGRLDWIADWAGVFAGLLFACACSYNLGVQQATDAAIPAILAIKISDPAKVVAAAQAQRLGWNVLGALAIALVVLSQLSRLFRHIREARL